MIQTLSMLKVGRRSQLQRPVVHEPTTPKRTRKIVRLFRRWHEAILVRSLRHTNYFPSCVSRYFSIATKSSLFQERRFYPHRSKQGVLRGPRIIITCISFLGDCEGLAQYRSNKNFCEK